MSGAASERVAEGVATVGMNCRFPGAGNVEQFWRNLRDGVECISFLTDEELLAAGKTVLVITHDDRYYHLADRLIKLEYGQVTSSVAEAAGARR